MLRGAILLLAAVPLAGCTAASPSPAAPAGGRPMRVMSLSLCTDQLLLALLPPERIASVTWLARDPDSSVMTRAAALVPVNHGLAEDVIRQQPDLILSDGFSMAATRGLLARLGRPVTEIGGTESFDQIRSATRGVARAVGEQARGEALIARMDRQLAELARDPAPPVRVAAWNGDGFGAPPGSLYDAVLRAAGAINVASEGTTAAPDTETLLAAAPALLIRSAPSRPQPGLRDNEARHPLVRRYWDGARTLTISPAAFMCGTPFVADAALALRADLRRAPRTAPSFAR